MRGRLQRQGREAACGAPSPIILTGDAHEATAHEHRPIPWDAIAALHHVLPSTELSSLSIAKTHGRRFSSCLLSTRFCTSFELRPAARVNAAHPAIAMVGPDSITPSPEPAQLPAEKKRVSMRPEVGRTLCCLASSSASISPRDLPASSSWALSRISAKTVRASGKARLTSKTASQ